MKFRNKILLLIYGTVLGFLLITFFVVNYWARDRIESTFADELRTSANTLSVLLQQQAELLRRACMVIAESPRLKAVTELRDPATAFQSSMEITQTSLNDLFMLTDDRGVPLVQILQGARVSWDVAGSEILNRARRGTYTTDLWYLHGGLYKVATATVMAGERLEGTLTIGFRYSENDLLTLRKAVNSAMALAVDTMIAFETLLPPQRRDVEAALRAGNIVPASRGDNATPAIFDFSGREETYLAINFTVSTSSPHASNEIQYIVMKPVGEAIAETMRPILGIFGFVSVIFLVITFGVGTIIARGITRPVRELVTGATEIGRGNYDHRIQVKGRDEMSILARQFTEMSASLKEKMTQLDALNRDLVGRNAALDDALRKLRDAQQEIVRGERLAATGKLTAQLAHEINNPIHNIQSCLKTALARLPGEAKGRDLITVAFEEIERLSKLTRQMLDFYRGSLVVPELLPVNLNDIVREVVGTNEEALRERGIHCLVDAQNELPDTPGSRDKLKQVFINLLINARDAMPDGGSITIRTREEHGRIVVRFADTGIGIPAENLGRVFDAFFTTKSKVSGVGLGLSVSYGIIGQHAGTIAVSSERGTGTEFTIELPIHGR